MKIDVPSFLLGAVVGAGVTAAAPRIRPLALEIATGFYRLADAVAVRAARSREDVSDLLAEARARARRPFARRGGDQPVAPAAAPVEA